MHMHALAAAGLLAALAAPSFENGADGAPALLGGENQPPVCLASVPGTVTCQGDVTIVQLDASASFDPDGDPLVYIWQVSPIATLDDNNSPTPTLTIDTSMSCDVAVGIRLRIGDGQDSSFCRFFVSVTSNPEPLILELDIKPGSCPNPVNRYGGGVVPVSLLGTGSFDVTDVNLATLQLSRADGVGGFATPTNQISFEDTGTPFDDNGCQCHDETGDGVTDLSLKFDKQAMVAALELENEPRFSYLSLLLSGELDDGTPFIAYDCIRVQ